jgi:hypothetical protein
MKCFHRQHKGSPHTHEQAEGTATNREDTVIIFRGVNFPDAPSLYMKNLVDSMPKRLEDFLSREGNPSEY